MRKLRFFRNPWTPNVTRGSRFNTYTFPKRIFWKRRGVSKPLVVGSGRKARIYITPWKRYRNRKFLKHYKPSYDNEDVVTQPYTP